MMPCQRPCHVGISYVCTTYHSNQHDDAQTLNFSNWLEGELCSKDTKLSSPVRFYSLCQSVSWEVSPAASILKVLKQISKKSIFKKFWVLSLLSWETILKQILSFISVIHFLVLQNVLLWTNLDKNCKIQMSFLIWATKFQFGVLI